MQAAVAFQAVFLRRLVGQRAVRPDRVVFTPEPACLAPGVGHRLELLGLQEFVAEAAVERFDVAELRAIVAANASWCSASPDHAGQHATYIGAGPGTVDLVEMLRRLERLL